MFDLLSEKTMQIHLAMKFIITMLVGKLISICTILLGASKCQFVVLVLNIIIGLQLKHCM